MKTLILICFILFTVPSFGQDKDPAYMDTVTFNFAKTVSIDSLKQDELYSRARQWFAQNFKDSKYVLQMDDKEAGKLIGRGSVAVKCSDAFHPNAGYVDFLMNVSIKDGKYKVHLNEFRHENAGDLADHGGSLDNVKPACGKLMGAPYIKQKWWRQIKKQAYDKSQLLLMSFDASMLKKPDSDW